MRRAGTASLPLCLLLAALALGCRSAPEWPDPGPRAPALVSSLVRLGDQALERGELAGARTKYQRALAIDAGSTEARMGMARLALKQGNDAAAEPWLREILDADPGAAPAYTSLAGIESRRGHSALARGLLESALAIDPELAPAHAALWELTRDVPVRDSGGSNALMAAEARPYDGHALIGAAGALLEMGDRSGAVAKLERALWLSDLDPQGLKRTVTLLQKLDAGWSRRQIVPAFSYADASVRADPGWRFRLRLLWQSVSNTLDPVLGIALVPAAIETFDVEADGSFQPLAERFRDFESASEASGLYAIFSARPPNARAGSYRRGQADFLGRRIALRLENPAADRRVLAHETLHLFGAVHVVDEVGSLMNPSGDRSSLDGLNMRIARELRQRRFSAGGLEENIFPTIDVGATTRSYLQLLEVNLEFRRLGALDLSVAPDVARRRMREASAIDPHMGDVARFVAFLLARDGQRQRSARLMEWAAHFYGVDTPAGKAALAAAADVAAQAP